MLLLAALLAVPLASGYISAPARAAQRPRPGSTPHTLLGGAASPLHSLATAQRPRPAARSTAHTLSVGAASPLHTLASASLLSLLVPPVDARAAFVRSVLAAPAALPHRPPRWLCTAATSAACAAAFPQTFAAVSEWHGARARLAGWELDAAARRIERRLLTALPAGSFRIETRVKSAASLFEKVWIRGKAAHDLLALRIVLVDAPRDAYAISPADRPHTRCLDARAHIADLFTEVSSRDYIARPKPNGYASLHSLFSLQSGASLEVQVRTERMHQAAETGSAAHAQYKLAAMEAAAAGLQGVVAGC